MARVGSKLTEAHVRFLTDEIENLLRIYNGHEKSIENRKALLAETYGVLKSVSCLQANLAEHIAPVKNQRRQQMFEMFRRVY